MIYAMSDIHGCLEPFEQALATIDLSDGGSKLVLLGDYCDRGAKSLQVLKRIMELQQRFPGQVIALRGNHEEMLIENIDMMHDSDFARGWLLADSNLATTKSFLDAEQFGRVRHLLMRKQFAEAYRFAMECMVGNHADVVSWVRGLPYYWEEASSRQGQVFVHAGIDEEAGDLWRVGTPVEWFTASMPDYLGKRFDLDVIAGHVGTDIVSGIPGYEGIYFDGASHYYIDGTVMRSGRVLVLAYDEATGTYSGPGL